MAEPEATGTCCLCKICGKHHVVPQEYIARFESDHPASPARAPLSITLGCSEQTDLQAKYSYTDLKQVTQSEWRRIYHKEHCEQLAVRTKVTGEG